MPPIFASLLGAGLGLVPVAAVVVARARRERPLWALALDLPLAVAIDLLLVLSLTRFMRLEIATFVSRGVWIAALAAVIARARTSGGEGNRRAWPRALGRPEGAATAAGALVGLVISARGAWPYSIWDRRWHTPLTSSLRGQTLPFENAVGKGEVLHYHFGGDVYGAMMQSLSLGVLHSSWALSLAHDLLFALTGAAIVLLCAGLGGRRGMIAGVPLTLGMLLSGPLTIGANMEHPRADGYSVINFLSLSFRPHDVVAGLFFVGFVGAVAARVWRLGDADAGAEGSPRLADTVPALLGSAAGLAVTDETTLGLLGLSLGLTWLAWPAVVHPRRGPGVLVFVGLLVALAAPNLAFAASVAPGAQPHAFALVPWRSPGCYMPTLPFSTTDGVRMFVFDALPSVTAWVGGVAAFALRRRPRSGPILAILTLLLGLSYFALARVDIDHHTEEVHRFVNGIQFLAPLLAALLLLDAPPSGEAPPEAALPAPAPARAGRLLPAAIVVVGVGMGAASTEWWIDASLPRRGHHQDHFYTNLDLYALDCRRDLGATLGAAAAPTYISKNLWYAYTGCQPTFAPAKNDNYWSITIGQAYWDKAALKVLHTTPKGVGRGERLAVICPRPLPPKSDAVCAWALAHARCEDLGAMATRCTLDAAQRSALLHEDAAKPQGRGALPGVPQDGEPPRPEVPRPDAPPPEAPLPEP